MDAILGICIGIGLAAACGFRVFVPLLVMSVAARAGHLELAESFGWIGSWPALIAFGVATALEIAAYYVPWLDNALDTVTTPAAVVAGIVVTASCITDMSPLLRWSLAIIAGGGAAGAVQGVTVAKRALCSVATGGVGNPLVSTAESGASIGLALLAVLLPLAAAGLAVLIAAWAVQHLAGWVLSRRRTCAKSTVAPGDSSDSADAPLIRRPGEP